ncbi:MAG: hypothetical protein ACREMZ_12670 [Gemmatimonadales bacterium]
MPTTLLTLGYEKRSIDEFVRLLKQATVDVLLDVRETAWSHQFEALVATFHARSKQVCIACFERHPGDCHRGIIAARWQERGERSVKHLGVAGSLTMQATDAVHRPSLTG